MRPISNPFKHEPIELSRKHRNRVKTIESIGVFEDTPEKADQSMMIHKRDSYFQNKSCLYEPDYIEKFALRQANTNEKADDKDSGSQSQSKGIFESKLTLKDQSHAINNRKKLELYHEASSSKKSIEKHVLKPKNTPITKEFLHESISLKSQAAEVQSRLKVGKSQVKDQLSEQKQISQSRAYAQNGQAQRSEKLSATINVQEHCQKLQKQSYISACDSKMTEIFEAFELKMKVMSDRIELLQQQDRINKQKIIEQEAKQTCFENRLLELQAQNQSLSQSNTFYRAEKQELEEMLKDVLFKRQKERAHISRQSTNREQSQSSRVIEAKRTANFKYINNPNSKQNSDSKAKVQNFLQKLQIKVERA